MCCVRAAAKFQIIIKGGKARRQTTRQLCWVLIRECSDCEAPGVVHTVLPEKGV